METAKGKTREDIINRLADRIDSFERYTQPHSRLMGELATRLARRFGLAVPDVEAIAEAAMLHDIGLLAMSPPPSYLALPRPLSFETRLDVWRHPVIGEQQMSKREASRHAQLLVRWHHEWWNGSGYPDMLCFEDIPIGARILRAVELYAALLCDRPYRDALDDDQALEALSSSAGIECDPYVVKALIALLEEMREPRPEINATGAAQHIQPSELETQPLSLPDAPLIEPPPSSESSHPPTPRFEFLVQESTDSPPVQPTGRSETGDAAPSSGGYEPWADWRVTPVEREATTRVAEPFASQPAIEPAPVTIPAAEPQTRRASAELLLSRARERDSADADSARWRGWSSPAYNKKALLGFQAFILRQLEFRSIAIPFWSEARLDLYLKAWGKLIFANDPREWAAARACAAVQAAADPLGEEAIARLLEDVYVPGVNLSNPALRRWFIETDAWWMDNLRRSIDQLDGEHARAQALALGLLTGDYALSFNDETRELRRPLTTIFWRLAGRAITGPAGQRDNRSFNRPAEEFIRHARADLLFLSLPPAHSDRGGSEARSEWRESWVRGSSGGEDESGTSPASPPQSKQSYLATVDRLLRPAAHFRTWAVEFQEPGLAGVQDVRKLIKEYRPVRATYTKDVTEVAGGLRSHIIVCDRSAPR